MKISVIIPCYNCEDTIERAINSVVSQDYGSVEIICVDDCSTDKTLSKLSYKMAELSNLRVISSDANLGAAHARNKGIDAAEGELIAFLDADDTWLPSKLSKQATLLRKSKKDWSATGFGILRNGQKKGFVLPYDVISKIRLVMNNRVSTSTVMGRRQVFVENPFPDLYRGQDLALWLTLVRRQYSYIGLNEVLTEYHIGEHSLSSNKIISSVYVLRAILTNAPYYDYYLIIFYLLYMINGVKKHLLWRLK